MDTRVNEVAHSRVGPNPHDGGSAGDVGPRRVGQYDVLARLGRGGMAEVFLAVAGAELEDFRKLVVLKVLHEDLSEDAEYIEMFRREARIAARLSHPNVVHTYTVGHHDGRDHIVMEYLEGVSLGTLLKRGKHLSAAQRLPILRGLCDALAGLHYVHEFRDYDGRHLSLVHRDFKPGNIYITFDGQVKVLDFGLAKVLAAAEVTASAIVKGTVHYMAPEALDKTRVIDRRVDVFAAGLIAVEVAKGCRLWGDLDHLQILRCLAQGDLPEVECADGVRLDPKFVAICKRAAATRVDERHSTALALKEDLERWLQTQTEPHGRDDLARLVQELFHDLRVNRATTIRERLETLTAFGSASDRTLTGLPSLSTGSDSHPRGSDSIERTHRRTPPEQSSRWKTVLGSMATTAGILAVGSTFWAWSQPRPVPHPVHGDDAILSASMVLPSSPSGESRAIGSDVALPATVTIAAEAEPSQVTFRWDGERLSGNPVEVHPAHDGSVHVLSATAPGYVPWQTEVRTDRDYQMRIELDPLVKPDAPEPPSSGDPDSAEAVGRSPRTTESSGSSAPARDSDRDGASPRSRERNHDRSPDRNHDRSPDRNHDRNRAARVETNPGDEILAGASKPEGSMIEPGDALPTPSRQRRLGIDSESPWQD